MPKPLIHPSREELKAYGLGQLSADIATVIEKHLSECDPCCETIADQSSRDPFVDLLQEAEQLLGGERPTDELIQKGTIPAPLASHPRYEIVGLIGKGGMGNVYEAQHRKMERTVALKVINREFVRKTEAVNRFHREVKTAAQLSHPNIVTAHDADNAGDYHFMVMEYVDGVDLSQIVKSRGALPVREACDYIHQAATGLHYAHGLGMVHRDIKPHNLMLTQDGTIKILDFGLASIASGIAATEEDEIDSELTAVGAVMGTPDFISPEQAEDARQADIRSDIYSLGATLYHLLSGRPPFDHGSITQKLKSHAQVAPERLGSLRGDIPVEVNAIVEKMLAKDPDKRFQTPAEVVTALETFLQADQPTRQPSSTQTRIIRSRPRLIPLTAIATVFLAAVFAGATFYLQTGTGTIRVELMDESLEASIAGETINVEDGDKEFEISTGRQKLVIRQEGSDAEFVTDEFRVYRNKKLKFEVRLLDGEVVVSKDGSRFDRLLADWLPPNRESGSKTATATRSVQGTGKVIVLNEAGQVVQEGEQLLTVSKRGESKPAVELWVSGEAAPVVQVGNEVKLSFEGWPAVNEAGPASDIGTFAGVVIGFDPTASDDGKVRVVVQPRGNDEWPDGRYLRPGVRSKGTILLDTGTDTEALRD